MRRKEKLVTAPKAFYCNVVLASACGALDASHMLPLATQNVLLGKQISRLTCKVKPVFVSQKRPIRCTTRTVANAALCASEVPLFISLSTHLYCGSGSQIIQLGGFMLGLVCKRLYHVARCFNKRRAKTFLTGVETQGLLFCRFPVLCSEGHRTTNLNLFDSSMLNFTLPVPA